MSEKFEQEAIEAYNYSARNNINESGVLMVTITLNEYRELVTAKVKADQLKETESIWQLRAENQKLRDKIAELTMDDNG